jgi:hypothetical protein
MSKEKNKKEASRKKSLGELEMGRGNGDILYYSCQEKND